LSVKYDYHIKYYLGRFNTYKLDRTTVTVGGCLLLRLCGHYLFRSSSSGFRALLRSRGLALHLRQEFFNSGGWATTPSGLPHRIPLAFVALINGLRRWQLLQTRKLSRQHINSRHEYSITSVKTAYLLGFGLSDLQLLLHVLAGRIARSPRRCGQTSLQASRLILNERDMR
jgi:hypothetical protein